MKVLITGGAGFLGLHLARYLTAKKYSVRILDIADAPLDEYPESTEFHKGDVRDPVAVLDAVSGCDLVVHAAAALPLRSAKEIMDVNVEGTRNVMEAALREGVSRVVHISSTAVYGVPEKHPIFEDDPRVGVGPYGESKIQAENICRDFRKKGLTVCVIRPKTFLGTHRLGVFEILFDWIHAGTKIPVIGSGHNRYQLLEVEDLCHAIYLSLSVKDPKKVNTEFNVGAAQFNTVAEDLGQMFRIVKSKSKIMATPAAPIKAALRFFEIIKLSPLYQWVYDTADKDSFVSIDKIQQTLGWNPQHSNTDALVKAYRWYDAHFREIKSRKSGTTHTVGWKQGILAVAKKLL